MRLNEFDPPTDNANDKVRLARALGAAAFNSGRMRVPAHDPELQPLFVGMKAGTSLPILEAWISGWDNENLAKELEPLDDEEQAPPAVADVILEQLGGRRFVVMTGSSILAKYPDAIAIGLPSRFAKDGINIVKVTLDPNDTYSVCFSRRHGAALTVIHDIDDVYNDQLQNVFTQCTGLVTHL